ncbi:MAG TPA: lytic transglycosylase domain-containing protein [Rhodopila sp.]|uniref:lytic transglycosylase domain-containing protein n=1 Tax=Rhodopila sp. TaxID=2480087 RepID=UPI002C1B0D35|nr:lytic transglycosylase domain-containing protein [Rhodopila sp.]HVY15949.1 lytic transglycosylase domain-containing protein [Rhodopila sp.]
MAVKSIIDIDINDSAFQKFREQFQAYQRLLKNSSSDWSKVTQEIDGSRESFQKMVESSKARLAQTRLTAAAEKEAANQLDRSTNASERQAHAWRDLAKNAGSFASKIADSTRSLLRWASITGVISGVLGAGGLFGIERLAVSAGNQRRSALGLGVTPGQLTASSLNLGRLVDPGALLGGVNEALHDPTKTAPFAALGLNAQAEERKGTAQAAIDVMRAYRSLLDRTDPALRGLVTQQYGLGQFGFNGETANRVANTPRAEFDSILRQQQIDARTLDLTQQQQKAWQDLQVQLNRAAATIEKTFTVALTDLAKPIGDVSVGLTHLVESLGRSDEVKTLIGDVANGLEGFAKFVGTPEFKTDVQTFGQGVKQLAEDISWALKKLGALDTKTVENEAGGGVLGWILGGPFGAALGAGAGWGGSKLSHWADEFDKRHPWFRALDEYFGWKSGASSDSPSPGRSGSGSGAWNYVTPGAYRPGRSLFMPATFRTGGSGGLPAGLLDRVAWVESHNNPNAVSPAGAKGLFQFMDSTWAQYGHGSVFDPVQSRAAAGRYFRDLLSRFNGNIEQAVAAYNWGPGNVMNDLATYGQNWRAHLPQETQRYIGSVLGGAGSQYASQFKDRSVTIKIENRTGGNASVTVSQLAV